MRWTRRTWMTLAALSAMCAAAIVAAAALLMPAGRTADLLKAGASLQFMHSMATLACATVVQIGGARARHAPGFFLAAIVLLSGSIYAMAFGAPPAVWATVVAGMLSAATGWVILASGTAGVDVPFPRSSFAADGSSMRLQMTPKANAAVADRCSDIRFPRQVARRFSQRGGTSSLRADGRSAPS